MVQEILKILECGFMDDHNLYFGAPLDVVETGSNKKYTITGLEVGNGLVAVQQDALAKEDLK